MLDLERVLLEGFCVINNITPQQLRKLPNDSHGRQLRGELRWALKTLTPASEARIKYLLGSSTRKKIPPDNY